MPSTNNSALPIGPSRDADEILYWRFLELLPTAKGVLVFLKELGISLRFREENLRPLDEFLDTWDDAEHEFLDAEIEQKRKSLLATCKVFCSWISQNTADAEGCNPGLHEIIPYCCDEWKPGYQECIRKMEEVQKLSEKLREAHQELVRTARRRLNVADQPTQASKFGTTIFYNAKEVNFVKKTPGDHENPGKAIQ